LATSLFESFALSEFSSSAGDNVNILKSLFLDELVDVAHPCTNIKQEVVIKKINIFNIFLTISDIQFNGIFLAFKLAKTQV